MATVLLMGNLTNRSKIGELLIKDVELLIHIRIFCINLLLSLSGLCINLYFLRFLRKKILMNPNLKLLLNVQTFFATLVCVLALFTSCRSIFVVIFWKNTISSNLPCVLLGLFLLTCLQVLISLEIVVMLERCYASFKYFEYLDVSKTVCTSLAILIVLIFYIVCGIVAVKSIDLSTFSEPKMICFDLDQSSWTLLLRIVIFIIIDFICIGACCLNFIVNRNRLKKIWSNQCQFNLKTRIQLSENIHTNKSILVKFLTFLPASFLVLGLQLFEVQIYAVDTTKFDDYVPEILEFDSTILLAYASLGPVAFLLADNKHRKFIIGKSRKAFHTITKCCRKTLIHPEAANQKVFHTNTHFGELNKIWNR